MLFPTVAVLLLSILTLGNAQNNTATYTNPIVPTGADPWMIRHDGYYYLLYTNGANITIYRSPTLTDWANAEMKAAFVPPVSSLVDSKANSLFQSDVSCSLARTTRRIYGHQNCTI